jgi:hypothetical protein
MLLAVDLGCKHQVLMLILLQQALIHIVVVSNDLSIIDQIMSDKGKHHIIVTSTAIAVQ